MPSWCACDKGHCLLTLLLMVVALWGQEAGGRVHMIYWNASNPLLWGDGAEPNRLLVNMDMEEQQYDQAHIVCPGGNATEYHRVLLVDRTEFESCRLYPTSRARIVADCSRLQAGPPIIITFRQFSPLPGGLEFQPGGSYYLLSTNSRPSLPPSQSASHTAAACQTSLRLAIQVGSGGGSGDSSLSAVRVNIPRSLDYSDDAGEQNTSRDHREVGSLPPLLWNGASIHPVESGATSRHVAGVGPGPLTSHSHRSSYNGEYLLLLLLLFLTILQ